jgi:hypothetical protein
LGEVELGRRADDHGVVAAELEDRTAESFGHDGCERTAHAGRAGGADDGDARILRQRFAGFARAEHELRKSFRGIAEAFDCAQQ